MKEKQVHKVSICLSMFIFGTIGVFVRHIPLSSDIIALSRGAIGAVFLALFMLISKKKPNMKVIKENLLLLFVSGIVLGINWILLFEAYRYTTVATATLCYYLGPAFVILLSPIVFKERLTAKKVICVILSFVGMIFVSGILSENKVEIAEFKGILFGVLAAVFYAGVMILNKKMKNIPAYDKTVVQLFASAITLIPYCFIVHGANTLSLTPYSLGLLALVGVVHTGIAYYLYFGSIEHVKMQTTAMLSYIDPVTGVLLSVFLLRESMTVYSIIGAVLIIGAALLSEINFKGKTSGTELG